MKCPKCKKEMENGYAVNEEETPTPQLFVCFNKNCLFYGIARTNEEWFNETK
jgi:hypothetical protein